MNRHSLLSATLLAALLAATSLRADAEPQQSFGFTGTVDSFNRNAGALVVEDRVFHISESTLVHKRRGGKGTLSDITPGSKIGFYPGAPGTSQLSEVWILPKNWKGTPGYSVTPAR